MKKYIFSFLFILNFLLTSCTTSSVAMTGAQALYDHHNLEKQLSNHYVTLKTYHALNLKKETFKEANFSFSTFNNTLLITGQAPHFWQKLAIERLVKKFSGEREIYNYTEITNPTSLLTQLSDTWITTKIKAQYIAAAEIDPDLIKVITENGIVYLMGIVPHEQADIAIQIAQETSGVQNVIKLFSYVNISKT